MVFKAVICSNKAVVGSNEAVFTSRYVLRLTLHFALRSASRFHQLKRVPFGPGLFLRHAWVPYEVRALCFAPRQCPCFVWRLSLLF